MSELDRPLRSLAELTVLLRQVRYYHHCAWPQDRLSWRNLRTKYLYFVGSGTRLPIPILRPSNSRTSAIKRPGQILNKTELFFPRSYPIVFFRDPGHRHFPLKCMASLHYSVVFCTPPRPSASVYWRSTFRRSHLQTQTPIPFCCCWWQSSEILGARAVRLGWRRPEGFAVCQSRLIRKCPCNRQETTSKSHLLLSISVLFNLQHSGSMLSAYPPFRLCQLRRPNRPMRPRTRLRLGCEEVQGNGHLRRLQQRISSGVPSITQYRKGQRLVTFRKSCSV